MKIARLIIFCLLLFVCGKTEAQFVRTGHYYFQKSKENTDRLKLYHVRNYTFIIQVDDQKPKRVIPSGLFKDVVVHNLPTGDHVIRVKSSSNLRNVDTTYKQILVTSSGTGKVHRVPMPKLQGIKNFDAVLMFIPISFVGMLAYISATWPQR